MDPFRPGGTSMKRLNLKLISVTITASILASSAAQAQFEFDPPVVFPAGFEAYPTSLALGRFNDDALLDVLVSARNVDGLALILMGNAESFFDAPIQLSLEAQTDWVIAEKLDGDMHLDLAFALRSGVGKIAVLKGIAWTTRSGGAPASFWQRISTATRTSTLRRWTMYPIRSR